MVFQTEFQVLDLTWRSVWS